MIQKLRRKFILIMMGIVTVILLAVFVAVMATTYNSIEQNSMEVLRQALSDEKLPPVGKPGRHPGERMPTLIIQADAEGNISFARNQIYFLEDSDIEIITKIVLAEAADSGVLRDYSLRFLRRSAPGGVRIAFADIFMDQNIIQNLVLNSLAVGALALLLFLFVSVYLANWAVRPVQQAWDRQRQFVADASHELKTPLTVILSNADMLSSGETFQDEKKARRMENIKAEAVRMKYLVEDMLTLARADSVETEPVRARVDFSYITTNMLLAFESVIYDDGKKLEYEVAEGLVVSGDLNRLTQLLSILLDNAMKYCAKGGRIAVELKESGRKELLLAVSNDGEEIPQDELELIFTRFYRVDKARSNNGGFGLGLAIANGIVLEHGGKIWAESDPKTGNTFRVTLPLEA